MDSYLPEHDMPHLTGKRQPGLAVYLENCFPSFSTGIKGEKKPPRQDDFSTTTLSCEAVFHSKREDPVFPAGKAW